MDSQGNTADLRIVPQNSAGAIEDNRRSKKLFGVFGLFNTEPGEDQQRCLGFLEALADLSPAEFDRAIAETLRRHRSSFLPTPGEVRGYLDVAHEMAAATPPRAKRDCPKCDGTGFQIVPIPNRPAGTDYKWAVRCSCLPPK